MYRIGLFALSVLCVCDVITCSWTQAHRNQITKIHNDYRKAVPGACQMKMIRYDKQLEKEAKAWSKRCVFEHQMKTRGENIAWYTKYGSESALVQKMAKMWYDEVKDYTYGQYGCGAACHYTQMVWSESTKVGCYAADCAHLQQGGDNAYFLVCFYSPAGNMEGDNPYKKNCSSKKSSGKNKKGRKNKSKVTNAGPSDQNANGNDPNTGMTGDGWSDWSSSETSGNWDW